MIASRPRSGRPPPGSDRVLTVPSPSGRRCPPLRQDSAPDCEAGEWPHIPIGCVVGLLRHQERRSQGPTPIRKGNRPMNVLMVTSKVKEEHVADAQAATEKVIQALERA